MSKNEALLNSLNIRLKDYFDAHEYFKKYNLPQKDDCLKKVKILEMASKYIKENKLKELKELTIPGQLTPDYICGCSIEDREKKYDLIINELNREKSEKEKELILVAQKLKSIDQSKLKKIEALAKKDIASRKEKIEKFKKIIELVIEKKNNVWTPVPLCGKDPNTKLLMLTQIYPSFKDKSGKTIIIFSNDENKNKDNLTELEKEELELKKKEEELKRKKEEIEKKKEKIKEIEEKKKLEEQLKKKNEIENKQLNEKIKDVNKEIDKDQIEEKKLRQKKKEESTGKEEKYNLEKSEEKIDKSKFSENEINDPENLDCLITLEVMKKKEQELSNQIKKIEGRTPKELRQYHNKLKVKITILEGNIQNGKISEKDYLNILANQFAHDKLLGQYFLQEGQNDKADIIAKRLTIILKELNVMQELIDNQ